MKFFRFLPASGLFVCAVLLAPLAAQTPDIVVVFKSSGYLQTSASAQEVYEPGYAAEVSFPSAVAASTQVQLRSATGVTVSLIRQSAFEYYREEYFANQAALDRVLPDGVYTVSVSGGGAATSVPLNLVPGANFRPVLIKNFAALQDWSGASLRIDWNPFDTGTASDFVLLNIERADGTIFYTSPSPLSSGALTGNSTTITIDRLNVAPGETVYGNLMFIRLDITLANAGRTAVASGSGYYVRFPITRSPLAKPVITAQPESLTVTLGNTAVLNVGATGEALSYQWKKNGLSIAGATNSSYLLVNTSAAMAGTYTVEVTNSAGTATSAPATLNVLATTDTGGIRNLAIRSPAGTGSQTLIVGFSIGGVGTSGGKPILIRGVGPALGVFGLTNFLPDPKLELYANTTGAKIDENDNWAGNPQIATASANLGAFSLGAATSRDAALYLPSFAAGIYSVQVSGVNGATGVALAEIYDASSAFTPATPRLTNVSARTQVGTGGDILIAGFNIGGQTARTVLLRAIGPALIPFGVTGVLLDPKLELFRGSAKINENDNWGGASTLASIAASVGAFALDPAGRDAVLLLTLPPGSYTAQVSGVNNATGVALVELCEVP